MNDEWERVLTEAGIDPDCPLSPPDDNRRGRREMSGTPDPALLDAESKLDRANRTVSAYGAVNFSGSFVPDSASGWKHIEGPWWYDPVMLDPPNETIIFDISCHCQYNIRMIKFDVYLAGKQIDRLRELSRDTGLPVSEHIRRAIDHYLLALEKHKQDADKKSV